MRATLAYALSLAVASAGAHAATVAKTVISADGTPIWAEARGSAVNIPVIFVHGIGNDASVYDGHFDGKDMHHTIYMVRFDMRGSGRSGKPADAAAYTSKRYAQDVEAVVAAFRLADPYIVAWGFGAAICADVAAYWPSPLPFRGFVYIAPVPYLTPAGLQALTPTAIALMLQLMSDDADVILAARIRMVHELSVQGSELDFAVMKQLAGSALFLTPAPATRAFTRTQDPTRLLQEVARGFPVLHLHGANDTLVDATRTRALLRETHANVKTRVYPDAGHAMFYDSYQVEQDLITFLWGVMPPNLVAQDDRIYGE